MIFDVGAHTGEDTDFYLGKGFRVVAVEANPRLASRLRERFAAELKAGRLTVVEQAVGLHARQEISFFVNDDHDDWSSLDPEIASKGVMTVTEVKVSTVTLAQLVAEFGQPYYLKVDIEGADLQVAQSLVALDSLPRYASFEFHDDAIIEALRVAGYDSFQIINQFLNGLTEAVVPPREGLAYWPGAMTGFHSGLFGLELPPADWVPYREALEWRAANALIATKGIMRNSWFDLHARTGP